MLPLGPRLAQLGVPIGVEQAALIRRFFTLLLKWNERVNLTGAGTESELVGEHLCDSIAMSRLVPAAATSLVDAGSGGGLPAIPFGILRPNVSVTLVESRAKRAAFLRTAIRELGLQQVEVFAGRLEDLARHDFDVASSRATLAPVPWLAAGQRLVVPGGRVIVFTSAATDAPLVPQSRLVEAISYSTEASHSRWAGAYSFT